METQEPVKYYLAEDVPFRIQLAVQTRASESEPILVTGSSGPIAVMILGGHKVRCIQGDTHGELEEELNNIMTAAMQKLPLKWTVDVRCTKARLMENGKGQTAFCFTFDQGIELKEILGDGALLKVEIMEWQYVGTAKASSRQFTTAEMPMTEVQDGNKLVFVDSTYNPVINDLIPACIIPHRRLITGKMSLLVIDKCYRARDPGELEKMGVYKQILEQELATDLVIIPSNDAEVKCHRAFLAAHSDVFKTMLGTDMQEAKTGRIEMPDMSEEGVRAFLAYLYHWDTSKAVGSCSVALELLMAGHKYNVNFLENAMRKLLLAKPPTWYNLDVAKQLFLFVRNLDTEWNLLKKKAAMVLNLY